MNITIRSDIAKLVQSDIEGRACVGKETYGTRLQPFNGRSALVDAYQEALDLCMYLRQEIEERYSHTSASVCHVMRQAQPIVDVDNIF
jgi:hypothetical protein